MKERPFAGEEICPPPPHGGEEKHIGAEMRMISNLIHRMFSSSRDSEEDAISGTNGWIIAYLAKNEDKEVFQRDLEEIFHVRRATISKTIRLMEHKGIIECSPVERDARLKKLSLTEKGKRLHNEKIDEVKRIEECLIKNIPREKLDTFFEVCDMIKQNIFDMEEENGV